MRLAKKRKSTIEKLKTDITKLDWEPEIRETQALN